MSLRRLFSWSFPGIPSGDSPVAVAPGLLDTPWDFLGTLSGGSVAICSCNQTTNITHWHQQLILNNIHYKWALTAYRRF